MLGRAFTVQGAVHASQSSVPDVQMHVDGFGSECVLPRISSSICVSFKRFRRQVYSTRVHEGETGLRLDELRRCLNVLCDMDECITIVCEPFAKETSELVDALASHAIG